MARRPGDRPEPDRPSEQGDGRNIDPRVGTLEGEAAEQRVPSRRAGTEGSAPFDVLARVPTHDGPAREDVTYYDRPVLKEPVWIWTVPAYFYVGGAAGASAVLAGVAQAVDRGGLHGLITRCRWIGAVGGALGTAFLVADLGRPERFLNMLRVFRPTSPLSVGSWILAFGAPLMAGSAALGNAPGAMRAVGDAAGYGAALTGLPLTGYTAVLLSNTAVPVWQGTRRTLPALFVASAVAAAADLLALTRLSAREEAVVHRYGLAGKVAELAAMLGVTREASKVERASLPLKEGPSGTLLKAAIALTVSSMALTLRRKQSSSARVVAAVLGTAGSICLKFGIVKAGTASARDPRATFRQQRSGYGGLEVTGDRGRGWRNDTGC